MAYTKEQIIEIANGLAELRGTKDSQLLDATLPLEGSELIAILLNGQNRKVRAAQLGGAGSGTVYVDKPLIKPIVTGTWIINNQNYQLKNLEVEKGTIAIWTGNYRWNHNDLYKNPESIGEESDFKTLTTSGQISADIIKQGILSDTVIKALLKAPVIGLYVNEDGRLVNASGVEYSEDSYSIKYFYNFFYGLSATKNPNTESLSKFFIREDTINLDITTGLTQYFVFIVPAEYSVKYIMQNGGTDIKGAFTSEPFTVYNESGIPLEYIRYCSNYRGAFEQATLNIQLNK